MYQFIVFIVEHYSSNGDQDLVENIEPGVAQVRRFVLSSTLST